MIALYLFAVASAPQAPTQPESVYPEEVIARYASLPALNAPISTCEEHVIWQICMVLTRNPMICGEEPDC